MHLTFKLQIYTIRKCVHLQKLCEVNLKGWCKYLKGSRVFTYEKPHELGELARQMRAKIHPSKVVGSVSFVPPVMGILLAQEAIKDI